MQHAEVGHKNLIIFSYKNHLDRFSIKRKQRIQQNLVCIFLIFLRFSTNFQSFSKSTLLFEIRFYRQAPGTFLSITVRPLVHEKHPGGWRGSPELGGSGGAFGRGRGGGGRGAHLLSICGRKWVEERRQLAGQRRAGSTAAANTAPASFRRASDLGRDKGGTVGSSRVYGATGSVGLRRCWPEGTAPRWRALAGPAAYVHADGRLPPL
jgi:hypothetical protein